MSAHLSDRTALAATLAGWLLVVLTVLAVTIGAAWLADTIDRAVLGEPGVPSHSRLRQVEEAPDA